MPSGVEDVAASEVRERLRSAHRIGFQPGKVEFELSPSDLPKLLDVRTIAGAWIVVTTEARRPAAVAEDLVGAIRSIAELHGRGVVRSVELNAAGIHSGSIDQLRRAIARTGLTTKRGGLIVRMRRRAPLVGWEALVAVAPRSLAERLWRVAPFRGSVNAALAAAIVRLARPSTSDRFLNLACGSGTIAIERALTGPARRVVATDIAADAIAAAAQNAFAAHVDREIHCVGADGRRLPFPTSVFDVVCADLPWGYLVGSHAGNESAYREMLVEAARVAERRARAVFLTAEVRLMQRVLGPLADLWRVDRLMRVEQGGARPALFVLRRA